MAMALGLRQVRAGFDLLIEAMRSHPFLNDTIPKEWPFKMSLDELGIELLVCEEVYREAAGTEIAKELMKELQQAAKGESDGF